ncbi:unnamed protein product [Orchesella dallaii]|uniref:Uncharacterized protein n=1 Tax=Orchesella dallaii TaxID=48710 RepID=A0ABP1PP62_9HEXA
MSSVSGGVNTVVSVPNNIVPIVNLLGLLIAFSCPVSSSGNEEVIGHGNFSQSPTNHEEVLVRTQDISPSSSNSGDDFWVGSHKLEFKPHPLLMPSTQSPASQIPIPILEFGSPPTTPSPFMEELSEPSDENGEVSSNGGSKKKSRDKRKKNRRDQRRLSHRTLWTSGNSNANAGSRGIVIKSLDQQLQLLQQPVILTGGSGGPTSLVLPSNRNDDTFRGSASTWNINHPNNNLNAFNTPQQQNHEHHQQHQHQQQQLIQQSQQQQLIQQSQQQQLIQQSQQQPYQFVQPPQQYQVPQQPQIIQQPPQPQIIPQPPGFPMSTGPEYDFSMHNQIHQPPQYIPQVPQAPAQPTGSNGPYLVYVPPGMSQVAQASRALPVKTLAINEIPMDYGRGGASHYSNGGGGYGESTHPQQQYGYHSPNNGPNPHYLRNNILRVFMDKLASVGKSLPIPFVTKYSHPPSPFGHGTQSQSHHSHSPHMNHVVYPPSMQPTTVYNRHYLSRRMR